MNKTESAVRLRHVPSGVVVTSQQERSQHRNKAICLQKLREKIERLQPRRDVFLLADEPDLAGEAQQREARIEPVAVRAVADEYLYALTVGSALSKEFLKCVFR